MDTLIGLAGDRGKHDAAHFCEAVLSARDSHLSESLYLLPLRTITRNVFFEVVIFANLRRDSLDPGVSLKSALRNLLALFGGLNYSGEAVAKAVINLDDWAGQLILEAVKVPYITYGANPKAMVRAREVCYRADGTSYRLDCPLGTCQVELQIPGKRALQHSLAAVAMGLALHTDVEILVSSLEAVSTQRMRSAA